MRRTLEASRWSGPAILALGAVMATGVAFAQVPVDPSKAKNVQPAPKPIIKNVAPRPVPPKTATGVKPPVPANRPVPKVTNIKPPTPAAKIVTPTTPSKTITPPKIVTPGTVTPPVGGVVKTPVPKTIVTPTTPGGTPAAKIIKPGSGVATPIKPLPPLVPGTKVPPVALPQPKTPLAPLPGAGTIKLAPPPVAKYIPKGPITPAPGLKFQPMKPPSVIGFLPAPKKPLIPPPKLVGPPLGIVPAKFGWHPWKGKNLLPYFFVGTVIGVGAAAVAYNYWVPPPPSCYLGGGVVYYYPGTRVCFDFVSAAPGDPFMFEDRVYVWQPTRYRTIERLIEQEEAVAEPVTTWIEKAPERRTLVKSSMDRAASRAQSVAQVPLDKLDCSTCLAALGPTEGEGGMCTVSLVNNCDHDVTASGGLTLTTAKPEDAPLCEFQGDVPKGTEVAACTKPCGEFTDAQVFLNAVVPVAGTAKPAPACRVPEPREARAP